MLYIIKKDYFLADYVLEAVAENKNITIIDYQRKKYCGIKKIPHTLRKFLRAFLCNRKGLWTNSFFKEKFLSEISCIKATDRVLFWGCENLKELLILDKEIKCNKKSVFLWNPVSTINRNAYSKWEYQHYLHNSGMQVYTFDEADAKRYGFNIVKQVYRKPTHTPNYNTKLHEYDVFYVGTDKHRSSTLEKIKEKLDEQGITYSINIVKDKHTVESETLAGCYADKPISYGKCLEMISKSRCILEILQNGQGGMTLRALEALFFKKKLITNNRAILHSPIYSPNNIYVIGSSKYSTLSDFINSTMDDIPNDIVSQYDISQWINQFLY